MRKIILGLALLGAAPVAALAQTSPATPDRHPPAAAAQESTQSDAARPVPGTTPRVDSVQRQTPGNATPGSMAPGSASTGNTTVGNTPGGPAGDRDAATGATTPNAPAERGNAATRNQGSAPHAAAPQAGANSFTEAQARSRIEAAGFTGITGLQKNDQGIWQGQAMRGGRQVSVALDYQGNVTTR